MQRVRHVGSRTIGLRRTAAHYQNVVPRKHLNQLRFVFFYVNRRSTYRVLCFGSAGRGESLIMVRRVSSSNGVVEF